MKKLRYILFIIVIKSTLIAQNFKSGEILYSVSSIDFISKENDDEINQIIENAKNQKFSLKFNNPNRSIFCFIKNLITEEKSNSEFTTNMAMIRFTCDFDYFLDLENNIEYFNKNNGALIKENYETKKWLITNESKTIDKYLCYKATYSYNYTGRNNKTKTREIIAWFAPTLPFSFGPKNYNGLPGLILELQDWNTTFLATELTLYEDYIKIEFPKAKSITKDEYESNILKKN